MKRKLDDREIVKHAGREKEAILRCCAAALEGLVPDEDVRGLRLMAEISYEKTLTQMSREDNAVLHEKIKNL